MSDKKIYLMFSVIGLFIATIFVMIYMGTQTDQNLLEIYEIQQEIDETEEYFEEKDRQQAESDRVYAEVKARMGILPESYWLLTDENGNQRKVGRNWIIVNSNNPDYNISSLLGTDRLKLCSPYRSPRCGYDVIDPCNENEVPKSDCVIEYD